MPSLLDFFKARRSVRRYTDRPVSKRVLQKVITAATYAPSAHDSQPWVFYVMKRDSTRTRVIDAMLSSWETSMKEDDRPPELIEATIKKFRSRFASSPIIILCVLNTSLLYYDRYKDRVRREYETILGHQSLAAAIQNLLLAASNSGLSCCWYSAPLFCQESIRNSLGLPDSQVPSAMITMGYSLSRPKRKKLRPLQEIVCCT